MELSILVSISTIKSVIGRVLRALSDTSYSWRTWTLKCCPEKAWLCILDAALVHISVESRCELQKEAKHIKLVFVSPGFTSVCQPLDVAVMRPLKNHLQRSCADGFAEKVLASGDGESCMVGSTLAANKSKLLGWVATAMAYVAS
eukprot:2275311-Amphidinium_carterae.1